MVWPLYRLAHDVEALYLLHPRNKVGVGHTIGARLDRLRINQSQGLAGEAPVRSRQGIVGSVVFISAVPGLSCRVPSKLMRG